MGVFTGGVPNPAYRFFPLLFGIQILHTNKKNISNPPYLTALPKLQIPHTKKFNAKILHTKKIETKILLSRLNVFFILVPICLVISFPHLQINNWSWLLSA